MTQTIKPIETVYAGCRFRSRLEARWAVFFDRLGVTWKYEPEGYELPSGRYLPDFTADLCLLNQDRNIFVEVKGSLDEAGFRRLITAAFELPRLSTSPVTPQILLLGDIPRPETSWLHARIELLDEHFCIRAVAFQQDGTKARLAPIDEAAYLKRRWLDKFMSTDDVRKLATQLIEAEESGRLRIDPFVAAAYAAARSARFEFGESG